MRVLISAVGDTDPFRNFHDGALIHIARKYRPEKVILIFSEHTAKKQGNIEIYYATHNEYINPKAKVLIVGITPGFIQMNIAISTARKELETSDNIEDIQYKCKVAGRFSGPLRKNIISMLNDIKLNEFLNINDCSELFGDKDYLMHTVSLVPYPVFVKQQNYTGHTPKLLKSDFLMKYIYDNFIDEINKIEDVERSNYGKMYKELVSNLGLEPLLDIDAEELKLSYK